MPVTDVLGWGEMHSGRSLFSAQECYLVSNCVYVAYGPQIAPLRNLTAYTLRGGSAKTPLMSYDRLSTVNEAGRAVRDRLRRQRCHQGRRRETRAINFLTA